MRDTMKPFRHAIFALLNGNISYNSMNVPVADEKLRIPQDASLFIVLSSQRETEDNTSDAFMTNAEIDIEIHHKTDYEVSKDAIDDVSNSIMEILMPTAQSDGFGVQNLWQFTCIRRISAISQQFGVTEGGSVVRKVVTIGALIVQQFP